MATPHLKRQIDVDVKEEEESTLDSVTGDTTTPLPLPSSSSKYIPPFRRSTMSLPSEDSVVLDTDFYMRQFHKHVFRIFAMKRLPYSVAVCEASQVVLLQQVPPARFQSFPSSSLSHKSEPNFTVSPHFCTDEHVGGICRRRRELWMPSDEVRALVDCDMTIQTMLVAHTPIVGIADLEIRAALLTLSPSDACDFEHLVRTYIEAMSPRLRAYMRVNTIDTSVYAFQPLVINYRIPSKFKKTTSQVVMVPRTGTGGVSLSSSNPMSAEELCDEELLPSVSTNNGKKETISSPVFSLEESQPRTTTTTTVDKIRERKTKPPFPWVATIPRRNCHYKQAAVAGSTSVPQGVHIQDAAGTTTVLDTEAPKAQRAHIEDVTERSANVSFATAGKTGGDWRDAESHDTQHGNLSVTFPARIVYAAFVANRRLWGNMRGAPYL